LILKTYINKSQTFKWIQIKMELEEDSPSSEAVNSDQARQRRQTSLPWRLRPRSGRIAHTTRVCTISTPMLSWQSIHFQCSRTSSQQVPEEEVFLALESKEARAAKAEPPQASSMPLSFLL
jgi:hypothetical protein